LPIRTGLENVLGMREAEPADHLQRRRHARIEDISVRTVPVSAIDELIRGDVFTGAS